jgi:histidinol dehydrogenase
LGDYASGTNHTAATNGYAKNWVVNLDSLWKRWLSEDIRKRIQNIGSTIDYMAETEGYKHTKCSYITIKSD